jgi:hypothetical protein
MPLVVRACWSFRGKDAGSARIRSDTGATEDAVLGASSAAGRNSRYFAKPSYGRRLSRRSRIARRASAKTVASPNSW